MTDILSDADNADPQPPRMKRWIDRMRDRDPEMARKIDELIDDWHAHKRRDKYRSRQKLAEFIAQPKYGTGVTAQEIAKYIASREPK